MKTLPSQIEWKINNSVPITFADTVKINMDHVNISAERSVSVQHQTTLSVTLNFTFKKKGETKHEIFF